jgi:aarF domain-containing kinase
VQWAATRHDLFAQDVCSALEKLHTQAPAHSFKYTCAALQHSFALPPSELFTWIEEVPVACGSIGQVHRALLSDTGAALTGCAAGDLVAIKVRKGPKGFTAAVALA